MGFPLYGKILKKLCGVIRCAARCPAVVGGQWGTGYLIPVNGCGRRTCTIKGVALKYAPPHSTIGGVGLLNV